MQKKASLLIGVTLIVPGHSWRWPGTCCSRWLAMFVLGSAPGRFRDRRRAVFMPACLHLLPPAPVWRVVRARPGPRLTTGLLLFVGSITGYWGIWTYLWPLEVLSLAAAFILMAVFLKIPWLMIPASILGFTGLVLQFWRRHRLVEFLGGAVDRGTIRRGLPLLLIGLSKKIDGVKLAGIILCGLAGLGFAAMSSVLVTSLWITRLIGPALVLGLGVLLVVSAMRKPTLENTETPVADERRKNRLA